MTRTSSALRPVAFFTNGHLVDSAGTGSRKNSATRKNETTIGFRGPDPGETDDSLPEFELELVKAQQRVEKGQELGKKDIIRFRAILHNERLRQTDIEFLANQFSVAAAYSSETPKPKIAAAMFHLRTIRARLGNLISKSKMRGDCQKQMWYDARTTDSSCYVA